MMARELTHAYKLAGHHTVLREKLEIDKEAIFFGLTWAAASTRAIMDLVRTKCLSDYEKRVERLIRNNYRETKDCTPLFFLAKKLGGKQANRDQALHSLTKKKLIERTGGKYYPVHP